MVLTIRTEVDTNNYNLNYNMYINILEVINFTT